MRIVVVGGGILGLATARLLAREQPDAELVVLEKEPQLGLHQTATNSGVVHAGIYYEPGSLKARLCRRGVELLQVFCAERDLPYEACGKLVVALDESELPRLDRLEQRATANGVPGLRRLGAAGLREIEPHAAGIAALHSPQTAITDFRAVALALAEELHERGGTIRTGVAVVRVTPAGRTPGGAVAIELADGEMLHADRAIVCAGLHADRLARRSGEDAEPRIVPFRGEYWALRPERRDLVRGLIYPVPDPSLPFLGVHLTRKVDGSVLIGPNAVLALAREGYRRRTVRGRDVADTLAWGGTWRLMRRHWRAGVDENAALAVEGVLRRRGAPLRARAAQRRRDARRVGRARAGGRPRRLARRRLPHRRRRSHRMGPQRPLPRRDLVARDRRGAARTARARLIRTWSGHDSAERRPAYNGAGPRGTGVSVTRRSPKPQRQVRFLGPPLSPRLAQLAHESDCGNTTHQGCSR